jgi:hypothetical protein
MTSFGPGSDMVTVSRESGLLAVHKTAAFISIVKATPSFAEVSANAIGLGDAESN